MQEVGRSSPKAAAKPEHGIPDQQLVPIPNGVLDHPGTVEEGAVGAGLITDPKLRTREEDAGVLSRCLGVVKTSIRTRSAPDDGTDLGDQQRAATCFEPGGDVRRQRVVSQRLVKDGDNKSGLSVLHGIGVGRCCH